MFLQGLEPFAGAFHLRCVGRGRVPGEPCHVLRAQAAPGVRLQDAGGREPGPVPGGPLAGVALFAEGFEGGAERIFPAVDGDGLLQIYP